MPGDYRDLHNLTSLTKIEGCLVNETPLRIGVGREPPLGSPVDLAVYRVNGVPRIPGSSLKGVFRSFLEWVAHSKNLKVHTIFGLEASDIAKEEARNGFCELCGIFGNTELASHVRIYDAYPKTSNVLTFIKTGVSIDRDFKGARPGALYNEELIPPGVEWSFRMDIYNIKTFPEPGDERGVLLKELFDVLKRGGLQVGARKTVGCGLMKLKGATAKVLTLVNGVLKLTWEGEV